LGAVLRLRDSLVDEFRWNALIRPRLEGLTDEEYFWEPVPGTLSVRPREGGGWALDPVLPDTVPLGNIAWRMTHLAFSLACHPVAEVAFGTGWGRPELAEPGGSAAEAIRRLDEANSHWRTSLSGLDEADFDRKLGAAAGPYADDTVLEIVLHVHNESLQRGADLCLLRDLYERLGRQGANLA
jgi:DinB family protein